MWSNVSLKISIFVLISSVEDLFTDVNVVSKVPTKTVLL